MGTERIIKNHMDILWHEYTDAGGEERPVTEASLTEKASIVGRVGIMLLSCGTGAWRVRSSMNTLSEVMGITCTADIGLMSIEYTCFDGEQGFTQSLCLTNTGVNTSKLNRLEHFIREFEKEGKLVAAICAAPSVLGQAGILNGKKAACHPGFEEKLTGAEVFFSPVVCDGNVITSRGMGTAVPFGLAVARYFTDDATIEHVKAGLVYA